MTQNTGRCISIWKCFRYFWFRWQNKDVVSFQKLVREIKLLIKEQKKAGKTGPLDLNAQELTDHLYERSLRRNNSMLKKAAGGFMGFLDTGDDLDDDSGADGLISAMNQLAWERDLDLTKGAFSKPNKIKEEPENETNANNSNSVTAKSARSRKSRNSSSSSGVRSTPSIEQMTGRDNAAAVFSDEHTGDISPVETSTQKQQFGMKDIPKGSSAKGSARSKRPTRRISPAPGSEKVDNTDSRPNSNNSNSNVSDVVALPPVSEQGTRNGSADSKDSTKRKWHRPRSRKNGTSAKQRSSSGGSEDSKDSVFSETGSRRPTKGPRQDSNSSTSLSSLMNAWEGGDFELQSTDLWFSEFYCYVF